MQDTWHKADTASTSNAMYEVSYGNGKFIVAGASGYVYYGATTTTTANTTTTDKSWSQTSAPTGGWRAIAQSADGTKLVAVSNSNTSNASGYIYTSTDSGSTWTAHTSAGTNNWSAVSVSLDGTKIAAGATTVSTGGSIFTAVFPSISFYIPYLTTDTSLPTYCWLSNASSLSLTTSFQVTASSKSLTTAPSATIFTTDFGPKVTRMLAFSGQGVYQYPSSGTESLDISSYTDVDSGFYGGTIKFSYATSGADCKNVTLMCFQGTTTPKNNLVGVLCEDGSTTGPNNTKNLIGY